MCISILEDILLCLLTHVCGNLFQIELSMKSLSSIVKYRVISNASFDTNIRHQNYKGFKPKRATRRLQDYSHGTTFLGPNQIGKCKHLIITFTLNWVFGFYSDDMFLTALFISSFIQNRTKVSER